MSNFDRNRKALDDFFSSFPFKDKATATRFFEALKPRERAIRYDRDDVSVTICGIFSFSYFSFGKDRTATVLNISSQGTLIASKRVFNLGGKIALRFTFSSQKKFKVHGTIANKRGASPLHHYGIKFDHDYAELGDYLLISEHNSLLRKVKNNDTT